MFNEACGIWEPHLASDSERGGSLRLRLGAAGAGPRFPRAETVVNQGAASCER
mgnify:CR=1 FL=1